jgi:haloalkane dehalogenase
MQRRDFVQGAIGALAANATASCASLAEDADTGAGGARTMDAAAFRAAQRFADTRFGRIAYIDRGAGPAALFLHGFPLSSFQWRGAIDRLSPVRRCIAADFMGLGFTEPERGQSLGAPAQVEMLATLLDQLGVDSVDLIANDSGGMVAQLFAIRYPARVRTMLLTNCDVEPDCPPAAVAPVIELARAGRFADEWLVPWVNDPVLARSAQGLGGLCYEHASNPTDEAIGCYLAPLVATPERKALINAFAVALAPNPLAGVEADLRRCAIATRIVWGTADPIFSPESPDYLDRLLPNSRGVRRVTGAKLFFPEEQPDLIAEEARALWGV